MKPAILLPLLRLLFCCIACCGAPITNARIVEPGQRDERYSHFDDKLRSIDRNIRLSLTELAAILQINTPEVGRGNDDGSGLIYYGTAAKDKDLTLTIGCEITNDTDNRPLVKTVRVFDDSSSEMIRVWTTEAGLRTPEKASPDADARYMIHVPLPSPTMESKKLLLSNAKIQRAAKWCNAEDSLIQNGTEQQLQTDSGNASSFPEHSVGFYDVRIPIKNSNDNAFGLVLNIEGSSYEEFFPLKLRRACDLSNVLFVSVKFNKPYGDFNKFLLLTSLCERLNRDFKLDAARSLVIGFGINGRPATLLCSLQPDRMRMAATIGLFVSPFYSGQRFQTLRESYFVNTESQSMEMGWLDVMDWKSPELGGTKWAYAVLEESDIETFNHGILPLWKEAGYSLVLVNEGPDVSTNELLPKLISSLFEHQ
jgi:hypothetical protein